MKHLFYCDTGYQIFTVLNLLDQLHLETGADLVIYGQFAKADTLYNHLKDAHIFENIYFIKPYRKKSKWGELSELLWAKHSVRKRIPEFQLKKYDIFYAAILDTNISLALYCTINFTSFIVFDDGTGSYHGNIIEDYISRKRRMVMRFSCSKRKMNFAVDKFYLYSPTLSKSTIDSNFEKIDVSRSTIIDDVFNYVHNNMYKKEYVFLDQPSLFKSKEMDEYDEHTRDILSKYLIDKMVVRKHPRKRETIFSVFPTDSVQNQWELECCRQLTDAHVLISVFSTASFQARILAGKRCHLILLFELYRRTYTDEYYTEIKKYVKEFSNCFEDTIVSVPNSWEEFDSLLSIICREELKLE